MPPENKEKGLEQLFGKLDDLKYPEVIMISVVLIFLWGFIFGQIFTREIFYGVLIAIFLFSTIGFIPKKKFSGGNK